MNLRRALLGALILALVPLLGLGMLASWTWLANRGAPEGPVWASAQPIIAWVDKPVRVTYRLERPIITSQPAPPPPPLYMALMVDVSGSMHSSLNAMSKAALDTARQVQAGLGPGFLHMAVGYFDTSAGVLQGWTSDLNLVQAALARLPRGGANKPKEMFVKADELMTAVPPGARRVLVLYTDGYVMSCFGCGQLSDEEIAKEGAALRGRGVEIFAVGVPGAPPGHLSAVITGDPSRVFQPADLSDLAANFRGVAMAALQAPKGGAVVSQALDGRHWDLAPGQPGWLPFSNGVLYQQMPWLPPRPITREITVKPRHCGLWRVGLAPAQLIFTSKRGKSTRVQAPRRPLVMVLSYWLLFFTLLPALLWLLAHLLQRGPASPKVVPVSPPVKVPSVPANLPALPTPPKPLRPTVPTLFVGLGDAGCEVLYAVRHELREVHAGQTGQPYRFLGLNLNLRNTETASPYASWPGQEVTLVTPPDEVLRVQNYLPTPGRTPAHLKWFPSGHYRDATRQSLELSTGASNDRPLARLALFSWLSNPDEGLWLRMKHACRELATVDSPDGSRQVVIFASPDGGTGGAWFVDAARLFRRSLRLLQEQGDLGVVPEITGMLLSQPDTGSDNARSLAMELETAQMAGAHHVSQCYQPNDPELEWEETETPFNQILLIPSRSGEVSFSQAASVAACLVQRGARSALMTMVEDRPETLTAPVRVSGLYVSPTQRRETARLEVLSCLLGPDVLPLKGASLERGPQAWLQEWEEGEPVGSPLRALLREVSLGTGAGIPELLVGNTPQPSLPWLHAAWSAGLSKALNGKEGRRPSLDESRAALELCRTKWEALAAQNTPWQVASRKLASLAQAAASEIDRWCKELSQIQERVGQEMANLGKCQWPWRDSDRQSLGDGHSLEEGRNVAMEGLARWLGTPQVVQGLRKRLLWRVSIGTEAGDARIALRECLENQVLLENGEELLAHLDDLASRLARGLSADRLSGALARLTEKDRRLLARSLVTSLEAALGVVLICPEPQGLEREEARAVAQVADEVPHPANQGKQMLAHSGDLSALRRLNVLPASPVTQPGTPHFVASPEQAAHRIWQKARHIYQFQLPTFPPRLRMALAREDRFTEFAEDFRDGKIEQRADQEGREQWYHLAGQCYLTFGEDNSLAAAAVAFPGRGETWPALPAARDPQRLNKVKTLLDKGFPLSQDDLVLAAMVAQLGAEA